MSIRYIHLFLCVCVYFSISCLEFANWNFEEAAKAFSQFKANIPLDAYI